MNKQEIQTQWKSIHGSNTTTDHIDYCILRAMMAKGEDKVAIAKHLLRKALKPITNTMKLANGAEPFLALRLNSQRLLYTRYIRDNGSYKTEDYYRNLIGLPADQLLDADELKQFEEIRKQLSSNVLVRRYSYFFTRQDIFDEYQLVQTAHVALELGAALKERNIPVNDLYFTNCGVANLEELDEVKRVLESMGVPFVEFREPDIGNEVTAIGCFPIKEHRRGLLRNYPLLRFKRNEAKTFNEKELVA